MTKPTPPRYSRKSPRHIRPRLIQKGEGSVPRHGIERPPKPVPKSLTELRIRFETDGSVSIPRYREAHRKPAEIVRERFIRVPNPLSAVRFHRNVYDSVTLEAKALDDVNRQLMGTHFDIERNWKRFNDAQKKSAREYVSALAGSLGNPNQLESHHKRNAHERLTTAIAALERGNDGAALLSIRGAVGDLVQRKNQLTRQRTFLKRRHALLLERISIERTRLEKYIQDSFTRINRLLLPGITKGEMEKVLDDMRMDYRSMLRKREEELKSAAPLIAAAGNELKKGKLKQAIIQLRMANQFVLRALGRQYVLNKDLLHYVSRSRNEKLRKNILHNQLSLFADNVTFWIPRAKSRESMSLHLQTLGTVMKKDFSSKVTSPIHDAALAVRNQLPTLAEEKLYHALAAAE